MIINYVTNFISVEFSQFSRENAFNVETSKEFPPPPKFNDSDGTL